MLRMPTKLSKKGRSPGTVDNWLDQLDMYRKNVAYDETCLFRAVSEQLFDCQIYHEKVRKESIEYGRLHFDQFKYLVNNQEDWENHLDRLEQHMVVCGNIEINLISKKYGRDILVFHANQQQIYDVTKQSSPTVPLMLCLMDNDHYDAVYRKEQIVTAGFCQSIVYKLLYENVFKVPDVDDIVNQMLYKNAPVISQQELERQKQEGNQIKLEEIGEFIVAPFPFKVAKALDPNIYRNIEYDSWGQVRRDMRLGEWYHGDDKLILGTKCLFNDLKIDQSFECYIQELSLDEDKCIVYLTKLGQKKEVKYSDLAPESNAQPWPLPLRFVRNTNQLALLDKNKDPRRRNRDRRQSKSISDLTNVEGIEHVNAFVGVPLHMKRENNNNYEPPKTETNESITLLALPPPEGLSTPMTPDINNYPQRYQWEPVNWPAPVQYVSAEPNYYPQSPEPFLWPQESATSFFDYKPMLASAPATPSVVTYHDNSYPYFYNYQLEQYPPHYPLTPATPSTTQQFPYNQGELHDIDKNNNSNGVFGPISTPCGLQNGPGYNMMYTPQSPQPLDLYSAVLNYPSVPGTPVLYTALPPSEPDMVVDNQMYTPMPVTPTEILPAQGYPHPPPTSPTEILLPAQGYPHPPPTTPNGSTGPWYLHPPPNLSYNSQGFIFPPPNINNNNEDFQNN